MTVETKQENILPNEKKIWFFSKGDWKNFGRKLIWILMLLPLAAYFHFGLEHLTQFETSDEFLWYSEGRIQKYWTALGEGDWRSTNINDKPGVTLAIISGSAIFRETTPPPDVFDGNRKLAQFPLEEIDRAHFNYRFPILLFNGILALYLFWVISKMTKNNWMALFSVTLILMQPILIGISQIINPDALFWSFAIALLFTFLAFLETGSLVLAFLSILFMGFTLASKYVGIIFFPFLIFALGVFVLFHCQKWEEDGEVVWKKIFWRLLTYLLVVFGGIAVFAFLMPATILETKYLARGTYAFPGMELIFRASIALAIVLMLDALIFKSWLVIKLARYGKYPRIVLTKLLFFGMTVLFLVTLADWMSEKDLFQLAQIPFEGGKISELTQLSLYKQLLLEARPVVFASTPLVLIMVIFFWFFGVFRNSQRAWLLFVLTAFIPIFFMAVIEQGLLVHVRYSIILFPLVATIAAVFLVEFFELKYLKYVPKIILFFLLVFVSWQNVEKIKPFYFSYANEFLPKKYSLSDGWGFGGYEAAQYLNELPEAENLKIVTDYTGVCQFFKGHCIRYTNLLRPHFGSRWKKQSYDYFVMSSKGFRRYGLETEYAHFYDQEPVWELKIDDRPGNFVRILSSQKMAEQGIE